MDKELRQVAAALKADDKAAARRMMKAILQDNPTADAWVMASHTMDQDTQKIRCLKKALELDPWHTDANRLILKLEETKSILHRPALAQDPTATQTQEISAATTPLPPLKRNVREMEYQRRERQRKVRRRFSCLMLMLFQVSCTFFTLGLIGVIPGFIGTVGQLFGGSPAITQVEGVPIEEIGEFAPATVPPSQSKQANNRDVDVLDHGYNHEYTFRVSPGDEILGYIQFMSVSAGNVPKNILIIDEDDKVIQDDRCIFYGDNGLLGGQGNVTFSCFPRTSGIWKVRVLGIQGESVGAYFVGVETISD